MDQSALEALLSELRSTQDIPKPVALPAEPSLPTAEQLSSLLSSLSQPPVPPPLSPSPIPVEKPLSELTFSESLPYLYDLSLSPHFVSFLSGLFSQQSSEELRLRDERNRLSLALSRTACSAVEKERKLKEWDKEARRGWKKLRDDQERRLVEWGVPCLGDGDAGNLARGLKAKKRVIDVLIAFLEEMEDLVENEDSVNA